MISYAQNFEDVILWRALKHIDKGFYIDIGAAWPEFDSVTAHFYESGWTGINVEPNPKMFAELKAKRVNDINLNCAVSDRSEQVEISIIGGTGLSTLNKQLAEEHAVNLGFDSESILVECITLNQLLDNYVQDGQEIHFLKVDVEGLEKAVIKGNDWKRNRPWIVLVESTKPMSSEENSDEWEYMLLNNDYEFVYFDGLNRFYVAGEHKKTLADAFRAPPNVFDGFVLRAIKNSENEIDYLTQKLNELKIQNNELNSSKLELQAQNLQLISKVNYLSDQLEDAIYQQSHAFDTVNKMREELNEKQMFINHIVNSASWKITQPLRAFQKFVAQNK